ncbi:MAG: methylthioribulose 1-phosphate dehydratase, partial [Nannocystaceae bacterium]
MANTTTVHGEIPALICELCRQFYDLGWVSGTGGGISIRGEAGIYIAPSGVQKERLQPEDMFVLAADQLDEPVIVQRPHNPAFRLSECRPLFFNAYRLRGAGAVMHSHSMWAVLATQLFSPGGGPGLFVSRNLEMQKGLRGKGCFDEVVVPIIANTPREAQLTESMVTAMLRHPDVDAVLVAGHGVYVWGDTWQKAKTQAECYDYLFRAAVEAHRLGLPVREPGKLSER